MSVLTKDIRFIAALWRTKKKKKKTLVTGQPKLKQTNNQTNKQTNTPTNKHTHKSKTKNKKTKTNKQTNKQTNKMKSFCSARTRQAYQDKPLIGDDYMKQT